MAERWLGVVVQSESVVIADAEVPPSGPITIQADDTWKLQDGMRPDAYKVMYQHVVDYVQNNKIDRVVMKASALNMGGTKMAHLEAAELRGVVATAAASVCATEFIAKALISRTFGGRKVDEYLKDDKFWATEIAGKRLRIGTREAAMVLLAARKSL
ncbi:MAG: hypothetical protein ABSF29_08650 [Tepidisphaeraceae bacterium]|jgi:hypothetical protein